MISINISQSSSVFNGIQIPEPDFGKIVGYTALTADYSLSIPKPSKLSIVSTKNRKAQTPQYQLYPSIYQPEETLLSHLTFALKYEGINLLVLNRLFAKVDIHEISAMVNDNSGIYVRKIWYLYEWLTGKNLDLENASKRINYALLADSKIQFVALSKENHIRSERHRITNNLLGTREFCPHIYVTQKISAYQELNLQSEERQFGSLRNSSILKRANAYLLLKDSKASFAIEGENPKATRLSGWAKAIGQAGTQPLTKQELYRLQQLVLRSKTQKKIQMGYRVEGGFIGDYEEITYEPRPEHLSAKAKDLDSLMNGLIETNERMKNDGIDAVVAASLISFGFVFIHPFVDGNGRIHRYLIHHILASKKYTPPSVIFPVSASIVNNIDLYSKVLKRYSQTLLDYIEWKTTPDRNVEVINDTIDFYRYFDATHFVEYLYSCIKETVEKIIPHELEMLKKFDEFNQAIEEEVGLPDNKIKLLNTLLLDNDGKLSKRKKENLFSSVTEEEVDFIEKTFKEIYK